MQCYSFFSQSWEFFARNLDRFKIVLLGGKLHNPSTGSGGWRLAIGGLCNFKKSPRCALSDQRLNGVFTERCEGSGDCTYQASDGGNDARCILETKPVSIGFQIEFARNSNVQNFSTPIQLKIASLDLMFPIQRQEHGQPELSFFGGMFFSSWLVKWWSLSFAFFPKFFWFLGFILQFQCGFFIVNLSRYWWKFFWVWLAIQIHQGFPLVLLV